jgi:hypothetical protein
MGVGDAHACSRCGDHVKGGGLCAGCQALTPESERTIPETPIAKLRAERSASGEHVLITRLELANLIIQHEEFQALVQRVTYLERRLSGPGARLEAVVLDGGDPRVEP